MHFKSPILYLAAAATSTVAQASYPGQPSEFTSTYEIVATPEQVVDANNTFTGGLAGAKGVYKFSLNSKLNIICYDITLTGFRGNYQSPASTATHIHEAVAGKSGPPRISFPNPTEEGYGSGTRRSFGCLPGTQDGFVTGLKNATTTLDQGFGFNVKRIEENPAGFFADVHSSEAVPGAVRGQFPASAVTVPTTSSAALSESASAAPATSSPVSYITKVIPANCTATCTTVYEECSESAATQAPTHYGTGSWTSPPAPPATGGYVPPPPASSATWVPPTGPSATPTAKPSMSAPVEYEGAAARQAVVGGLLLVAAGLLPLVM